MTDDEKRKQSAMLLLEHQEADQHLAHLRERAMRLSSLFADMARWLNAEGIGFMGGLGDEQRDTDIRIRNDIPGYMTGIDFGAALQLMDQIVAAERTLNSLSQRKQALGLK